MRPVRSVLPIALGAAAAATAAAQQLFRVVALSHYYSTVEGHLVPILECDANGCAPDPGGVRFLNSDTITGSDIDDPVSDGDFDDNGSTDGGLKDTQVSGTFGVAVNAPFFDQETSTLAQSAFVGATMIIGDDLYSAEISAVATIESVFRLSGLPNDQFSFLFFLDGGGGELDPVAGYGPPGTVRWGPNHLTTGAYRFRTFLDPLEVNCTYPECDDLIESLRVGNFLPIGAFTSQRIELQRDDSLLNWRRPAVGFDKRAWAFLPQGNSRLVVGGTFESVGAMPARRIAAWNGLSWSTLGQGFNGGVRALVEYNGGVVAAGGFTEADGAEADHVAFWNGSQWLPMGNGLNRVVRALAVWNGVLYAGGEFTATASQPFASLARWDETTDQWVAVPGVILDGPVFALAASQFSPALSGSGALVFGGDFDTLNGGPCANIGALAGSPASFTPTALNGGVNGTVNALSLGVGEVFPGFLSQTVFAGGDFSTADGFVSASNIAVFDLGNFFWDSLDAGLNGPVNSLYTHNPGPDQVLVAGGEFTTANAQPALRIARFDHGAWSSVGPGFNNSVGAVSLFRGELFATGDLTASAAHSTPRIARWTLEQNDIPCPADFDAGGSVNFGDLNFLLTRFNTAGAPGFPGDIDWDGDCDFADLNFLLTAFNTDCSG